MKEMDSEGAKGTVQLAGLKSHGALWRVISDLFVTRLGTCMLVRSLVLENRYVCVQCMWYSVVVVMIKCVRSSVIHACVSSTSNIAIYCQELSFFLNFVFEFCAVKKK